MNLFNFIISPEFTSVFYKLLIAFLLSLVIGIEREVIHKPAGIKTHSLICISACLVMAIGTYMYDIYGGTIDPSRLPAQILAGIGFVGAGTIIRDGFTVKGITTAASLLAITCIGLAVGVGFYEGAILSTLFVFLILFLTAPLQSLIHRVRKVGLYTITVTKTRGSLGELQNIFEEHGYDVYNIKELKATDGSDDMLLKFLAQSKDTKSNEYLISELCNVQFVKEVYISKKSYHQDVE